MKQLDVWISKYCHHYSRRRYPNRRCRRIGCSGRGRLWVCRRRSCRRRLNDWKRGRTLCRSGGPSGRHFGADCHRRADWPSAGHPSWPGTGTRISEIPGTPDVRFSSVNNVLYSFQKGRENKKKYSRNRSIQFRARTGLFMNKLEQTELIKKYYS